MSRRLHPEPLHFEGAGTARSPPSLASLRKARSTLPHPGEQLDAVHHHVRRHRRRVSPGPIGVYSLPRTAAATVTSSGSAVEWTRPRDHRGGQRKELDRRPQPDRPPSRRRLLPPRRHVQDITVEVTDAGGENPTEDMFKFVIKVVAPAVEEVDRAKPPWANRTW